MTNINLLQSAQETDKTDKNKIFGKSFFVPASVFLLAILIWGGAKFYSNYLTNEKLRVDNQVQMEYGNLNGKSADRIVDFQERLKKSVDSLSGKKDYSNCLKELESLTVSGAKIDLFKYSSSLTEIKVVADNFKTVARQLMSFKQSDCFKDLQFGETTRNDAGNIIFSLKNKF